MTVKLEMWKIKSENKKLKTKIKFQDNLKIRLQKKIK